MWCPTSWDQLTELLGEAESSSLDFKRVLGKNEEIAKDIAAMTVNGGVLLYGVDEDKGTCVATELAPFPIAGIEERLRHVSGMRIDPVPDLQVHVIPSSGDPSVGIVAVAISASALAPHQANKRFPCRRGTITDYLDQREVERLYRQRQDLSGPPPEPGSLLDRNFVNVLDGFSIGDGTGAVALVVRPAARDVHHPAGAWQNDALTLAVRQAIQRQAPRLSNSSLVRSTHALADWQPRGADGWQATNAGPSNATIAPQVEPHTLIAGCLSYPACLSFMVLLGLRWERGVPRRDLRSAREVDLLYELVALLAISGEYFSAVSSGAHLFVEARLSGFAGAKSQMVIGSGSTGDLDAALRPPAPDGLTQAARTSAVELRDTPELVARQLIERWLPAFYTDDRDLFSWIVPSD
jgi:hypothetical protein